MHPQHKDQSVSNAMNANNRNYGPPIVRKPTMIDIAVAKGIEFLTRLSKQMAITLAVSSLRALGDYLLSVGSEEASSILKGNMAKTSNENESRDRLYGRSASASPSYSRYGSYQDDFPGFSDHRDSRFMNSAATFPMS